MLDFIRIVFAAAFLLFIPGFVWSHVIFPRKQIDWIERIALSFGLSIAIVPLTVFWLNWLLHVKITLLNTGLTVAVLTLLPVIYLLATRPDLRSTLRERSVWLGGCIKRPKEWRTFRSGRE